MLQILVYTLPTDIKFVHEKMVYLFVGINLIWSSLEHHSENDCFLIAMFQFQIKNDLLLKCFHLFIKS